MTSKLVDGIYANTMSDYGCTASKKYTKHTYLEFTFVYIVTLDI